MGRGRTGWRPVGEEMLRLDVRKLHREGWLRPGLSFSLNWSMGGNPVGSISIFTSFDSIRLSYSTRAGTAYPVTFKPKHMHQRTFDRIRWQIQEIELGFWLAMGERFNLTPDF